MENSCALLVYGIVFSMKVSLCPNHITHRRSYSRFQGSEKKYTYTIITTDSNQQLSFLHDRMPVILENGSDQIRNWLDPKKSEWSKELQSLLKPYSGELECYAVSKEVGKVGNNSTTFIVPVASTENKNNIANFFPNARKAATKDEKKTSVIEGDETEVIGGKMQADRKQKEDNSPMEQSSAENSAPLSVAASISMGLKRKPEADSDDIELAKQQAHPGLTVSPEKTPAKKSRSATSNRTKGSPIKSSNGSQRITDFFNK